MQVTTLLGIDLKTLCQNFRGVHMLIDDQSADPAVHALCIKIAKRCVWIIQAVLREEERGLAINEFYRVCREELDKPPRIEEL